ncbi:MAG: YbhN family protein [Actinomycetes bacterium]
MTTLPVERRRSRKATVISLVVGLVVMIAVFAFLFPQLGTYEKAIEQLQSIPTAWIVVLVATGILNIAVYPLTAIAAIPGMRYWHAFVDRQVGFMISNVIPGGGAVAVGTQYSILSFYGVSAASAAAAVSADAVWTYLMVLGTPALAVGLLVITGRSAAGYTTAAVIGLIVVIVSVIAIAAVLRSPDSARRLGTWLQRPANRIWGVIHRQAPDVTASLVGFNKEASAMVAHRWPMLTATNVLAQLAPYFVLLAALAGLGAFPDSVNWIEVFAAYSIALLLTSFPITPGGLGTVDAVLVLLLTRFGVSSTTAIATDLIWRLVWFLPQLLVGLAALGIFTWEKRRRGRMA